MTNDSSFMFSLLTQKLYPEGVSYSKPRVPRLAGVPWKHQSLAAYPERVTRSLRHDRVCNLDGVSILIETNPQGSSRSSQPWALRIEPLRGKMLVENKGQAKSDGSPFVDYGFIHSFVIRH